MPDHELIEAQGDGSDAFGAPTEFYLTYRDDIERWHALKGAADAAVHEFLQGTAPALEATADALDMELDVFDLTSRYHAVLLWPPGARPDPTAPPTVSIGLGWRKGEVVPERESSAPYVGVYTPHGRAGAREHLLDHGDPTGRDIRTSHGHRGHTVWPAYVYVPAETGWWGDLDVYRDRLVDTVAEMGRLYRDRVIDAAGLTGRPPT